MPPLPRPHHTKACGYAPLSSPTSRCWLRKLLTPSQSCTHFHSFLCLHPRLKSTYDRPTYPFFVLRTLVLHRTRRAQRTHTERTTAAYFNCPPFHTLFPTGPRTAAGPAPCPTAHAELNALLQRGPQRRCVQHQCVHPLPLLLPLPFPRMFTNLVGPNGDVRACRGSGSGFPTFSQGHHGSASALADNRSGANGGWAPTSADNRGGANEGLASTSAAASSRTQMEVPSRAAAVHDVSSVPAMTRLAASREFEGHLVRVRRL